MADESLVPRDQPYGQRKATVTAMRQAGMPLGAARPPSPSSGGRAVPSATSGPPAGPSADPAAFDALLEMSPPAAASLPRPMVSPLDALVQMAAGSNNLMLKEAVRRIVEAG